MTLRHDAGNYATLKSRTWGGNGVMHKVGGGGVGGGKRKSSCIAKAKQPLV